MEKLLIDIHTHKPILIENVFSIQNLIANQPFQIQENQFYSIGLHPWYLEESSLAKDLFHLESNLQKPNVIAVGEIGLDKICKTNFDLQIKAFELQILLAQKYNLPIIIHCVKAFYELMAIVKKKSVTVPFIIHGFNQNIEILEQLLKNNFYISIGATILNEKSNANKYISLIPIERLFLETDTRDIQIEEIYMKVCEAMNINLGDLTNRIKANFLTLFGNNIIVS